MKNNWQCMLAAVLLAVAPWTAHAWNRTPATTFATLPAGATNPEGIAVDRDGRVYVSTFAVGGTSSGLGQVFVFDRDGPLQRTLNIAGSSTFLLDLAFHPTTGALLVIDFGAKNILSVNPVTGAATVFTTIPGGSAAGPNVLTFDDTCNVYISDSFQGGSGAPDPPAARSPAG